MTDRTADPPHTPRKPPPTDGFREYASDLLRRVSRVCAVPTAILAFAALFSAFAPPVPRAGQVIDVRLKTGRSARSAPYELKVWAPSGNLYVDVDRALGEAVVTGDSAVVLTTPVFEIPRSVTVYRGGQTLGSSSRAGWFAWGGPLFLLFIAGYTWSRSHESDSFGVVLSAAFFNVGVTIAAAVVAFRALAR